MIVKVQGGGAGTYANTGTSEGVVNYLQHEDAQRMQEGRQVEHFFSQTENKVKPQEVTSRIDNNRKGLKAKEAKFYVITVAPSAKELAKNGYDEAGTGSSHERVYPQGSDAEVCRGLQ